MSELEAKNQEIKELKRKLVEKREEYERRLIDDHGTFLKTFSAIYGEEEIKQHYSEMRDKQVKGWMDWVREQDDKEGRKHDIEGIINFLYKPSKDQGFEYSMK